jgi:DNA mismatch repair protein MutH
MPTPRRRSYAQASESDILDYARAMEGVALRHLQEDVGTYDVTNKGQVGDRLEQAFGLTRGGHGADFATAGIELKSTELTRRPGGWSVRWRTSVGMINPRTLPAETWSTASVRAKLAKILFIFYRREKDQAVEDYVVDRAHLWQPSPVDWSLIRADWEAIRGRVCRGEALSESATLVLGAATKGTRASTTRAFSLKRPFVDGIYQTVRGARIVSVTAPTATKPAAVVAYLRRFAGWTVGDVMRHMKLKDTSAKNLSALAIWGLLGARSPNDRLKELDDAGVTRRTVPIRSDGEILDPTSMMGFRVDELSDETWKDSHLREAMERILFVPLHGAKRNGDQRDRVVGEAFLWSPSSAELAGIAREWTLLQSFVSSGRILDAPPASETKFIHIRTKGRDATDIDPGTRSAVPRRGFYLNKTFVRRIIERAQA